GGLADGVMDGAARARVVAADVGQRPRIVVIRAGVGVDRGRQVEPGQGAVAADALAGAGGGVAERLVRHRVAGDRAAVGGGLADGVIDGAARVGVVAADVGERPRIVVIRAGVGVDRGRQVEPGQGAVAADALAGAGGGVAERLVRHRVAGDRAAVGGGLADGVIDGAARVGVVAADVGERPRIVVIRAGVGVDRGRQVEPGQGAVAADALAGAGGGVAERVVRHRVAGDRAAVGGGLADGVIDGAARVGVVAADVGERPRIVVIRAGVGVDRGRQVEPGQGAVAADALAGAGGGVAERVVRHRVAGDRAAVGGGLADGVIDGAARVGVVAADVGERPRIVVIRAGVGVDRGRQVEPGQGAVAADALAGAGGGVAERVVRHRVAGDRAAVGGGLADGVIDGAARVGVVAADVGERPRIVVIRAGVGVDRGRQVEPGQGAVAADALAGAGGGVAERVVRHRVAGDRAAVGGGLADGVIDGAARVGVVAADVGERPRIVVIRAGVGVDRGRQVEPGQGAVAADALAGAGGGVAERVVRHRVAGDRAAVGGGLADGVIDGAARVGVVAADVGERPRIVVIR